MSKIYDIILIILLIAALLAPNKILSLGESGQMFLIVMAFISTIPIIVNSIRSLKNKKISIDILAGIALAASLILKEWTSAIFINLMLSSARVLSDYSQGKARSAINSLLKLRPQKVKIKTGDKIVDKNISEIKIGDLAIVESGDRIAVDGIVESGNASINQSSLTGESMPVFVTAGSKVFSSTLNEAGSIIVRVEKIGKDTTLEGIIKLVETAQQNKPQITSIAEKFAGRFIFATLLGSIIVFLIFRNFTLLLSLLLVACADDIAVAVPLSFIISIGTAAKQGIIIKGGNFLELMTRVKTVIVDKTGTLTRGKLHVEEIVAFGTHTQDEILKLAANTEYFSKHPAAKAIVKYAQNKKVHFEKPENFMEIPGEGETAILANKKIIAGKLSLLQTSGVPISAHQLSDITLAKNRGLNTTLIAFDNEIIGFIGLADEVRPEARETIAKMRSIGIDHWIMLTGDNESVAQKIATEVDISEFHANLLPEDKLNFIKSHLGRGTKKVAMVGDGVNDAAALALSDVGIAMGAIGTDAAIEAADIALMKDDFSKIPEIVKIGQRTLKVVRQNFWIWGIVNIVGFILIFSKTIGPEGAAAYNFVTDFIPLFNTFRLMSK